MPNAILRYMLQGMRSARRMRSVCSNVSFLRVADTMFVICALGDQLVVIQCYAVQSCSVLTIAVVWQIAIPVLRSLVNTNEQLRHSCVAKSLCNRSACLYCACIVVLFGVVGFIYSYFVRMKSSANARRACVVGFAGTWWRK
jgi:hypothetical protein